MPTDIDFATLTPATVLAQNPLGMTRADGRDGTRDGGTIPPTYGLIFSDSFDDQPDWNSGLPENSLGTNPGGDLPDRLQSIRYGHTLPVNWYACYQDPKWAPSTGHPDRRETINIAAADAALWAKGGVGKCVLMTRDSDTPDGAWNSDSTLMYKIPDELKTDECYVKFDIKFDPDWTGDQNASDKLFRISCYNGNEPIFRYFSDGNHGPIAIWNWNRSGSGVRLWFAFRGGPYGSEYYGMDESRIENLNLVNNGDASLPWTTGRVGQGPNGTTADVPDLVNGGYLSTDGSVILTHEQVFGDIYHEIGFYVKMQSAPNVADGQFAFYFDRKRVFCRKQINWCPVGINGTSELPKWNSVDLGGNDNFTVYEDAVRRQEFYAIDNVDIYNTRPPHIEWDDE